MKKRYRACITIRLASGKQSGKVLLRNPEIKSKIGSRLIISKTFQTFPDQVKLVFFKVPK